MHADHHFSLAGPHAASGTPCQDYAWSGALAGGAVHFALVADGSSCAGGAKGETDIGARLLAHAFVAELQVLLAKAGGAPAGAAQMAQSAALAAAFADGSLAKATIQRLMATRFTPSPQDLLSTLCALVCDGQQIHCLTMGDGVLAVKYFDGSIGIKSTCWNGNAPYYPAYFGQGRFIEFVHHQQNVLGQPPSTAYEKLPAVTVENILVPSPGSGEASAGNKVEEAMGRHVPFGRTRSIPLAGVETVAVFSDGVASFPGPDGSLPLAQVLPSLMDFKSHAGRFVARRAIAALGREFKKPPQDDFSMAAISFRDE